MIKNRTKGEKIFKNRDASHIIIIVVTLILLVTFFSIMKPNFISYGNIMDILLSTCVNGLLALGVSFVIVTGGIDISLGAVMTFSSVIGAIAFTKWGLPLPLAILVALLVGTMCGLINGFGVTKMFLPPFIATMAMQMIAKGLSMVTSNIKPIYYTSAPIYQKIAQGSFLGIKGFFNGVVIFFVIAILTHIVFSKTLVGRYALSIGSNEEATRLSGVKVNKWKIIMYGISGLFAGLAGVIMSSRLNSAQPALGVGYEMEAIAAAVIGGNSLSGGEGSILGTIIGALIISSLTNGLRIMSVPTELQSAIVGVVLALAVYFDKMRRERRA